MKILRPALFVSLCIFSCASKNTAKISKETDLFVDYVKALNVQATNPMEACLQFTNLANSPDFILKDVAYVRAARNCLLIEQTPLEPTDVAVDAALKTVIEPEAAPAASSAVKLESGPSNPVMPDAKVPDAQVSDAAVTATPSAPGSNVAKVETAKPIPSAPPIDWSRPVPTWLDGEKKSLYFTTLKENLEKGLFVRDNTSLFRTPDRILYYQKALATKSITGEQRKLLESALYSLSPRFMPKPTEADYLRIAKDYRSVRQFKKSYDYLGRIVKNSRTSKDDKMAALKELFYTHKLNRLGNRTAYIQAAKKWANFLTTKDLETSSLLPYHYEANVNLARVLWTEQGTTEALATLDKTEKALSGRHSIFDVLWLRGRIFEEQKKVTEAQAQFEKAANEPTPNWKEKEKILWSLAWSFFKAKNFKKATEYLDTMISHPDISTTSRFKYVYWKGEAFQRQSQSKEARDTWESLAKEDIYGYYGLLAHHQLNRPLATISMSEVNSTSVLTTPEARIFNALIKVDEFEFAQKMLVDKLSETNKVLQMSSDDICALFQKLAQVNSYSTIFNYFVKLPYDTQKQVFQRIPKTLFPSPYLELVTKAAADASIEAELIYSIMRQESSFNPMARSPMDAFGLMQVLPDVAKRIARSHKIPYRKYEDLYTPEINVPIGAYLLKRQNTTFDNKFVLMVASYNASQKAVKNWYSRYDGDDLVFIEDIPYEETKAYVKLVTRNLVLYKKMLHGKEFTEFPRHLLEL